MIFERAKQVGDEGERQVAEVLERIASQFGMQVLHNVLLKVGPETAQIDHIVVDRYGVLLVETKVRRGAMIRGRDVEHRWTACYPKVKPKVFQNPLQQNDQHAAVLRRILHAAGRPLDPDYVRSAIVFVGADISQLELDSLHRMRVMDLADLARYIQARHDFAINPGALDARAVAALANMIRELDMSGDAEVERAHAARARGRGRKRAVNEDEFVVWKEVGSASRIEGLSGVRIRHKGAARLRSLMLDLLARVAVLLVTGVFLWWLFAGAGAPLFQRLLLSSWKTPDTLNVPAPDGVSGPSVAEAKAALAEAAPPSIVAGLVNPDQPTVEGIPQGARYTWEYVETNGNEATVRTISITLDASGQMVGVNIQ